MEASSSLGCALLEDIGLCSLACDLHAIEFVLNIDIIDSVLDVAAGIFRDLSFFTRITDMRRARGAERGKRASHKSSMLQANKS